MALLIRSRRSKPSPPFPGRHQTASVTSLPARGAQSSAYTQCVCDTMACHTGDFIPSKWWGGMGGSWGGHCSQSLHCVGASGHVQALIPLSHQPFSRDGLSVSLAPHPPRFPTDSAGISISALEGREHDRISPAKVRDAIESFEPAAGQSEWRGPSCLPALRLRSDPLGGRLSPLVDPTPLGISKRILVKARLSHFLFHIGKNRVF
jgi:hypothetical protein